MWNTQIFCLCKQGLLIKGVQNNLGIYGWSTLSFFTNKQYKGKTTKREWVRGNTFQCTTRLSMALVIINSGDTMIMMTPIPGINSVILTCRLSATLKEIPPLVLSRKSIEEGRRKGHCLVLAVTERIKDTGYHTTVFPWSRWHQMKSQRMRRSVKCLSWWRHQIETFSVLLAIRAANSPASGEFPTQRLVTRSFDVFFDLCLNKRLRKQSWGWWFETISCPLWRHCNGGIKGHLMSNVVINTTMVLSNGTMVLCIHFVS